MPACRAISILYCFLTAKAASIFHQSRQEVSDKVHHRQHTFLKAGAAAGWEPPWEDTHHHKSSRLTCGVTEQVKSDTDKYEDCPADCPYFAQNRKDTDHCSFLCVSGNECGTWNQNKPIPDNIKGTKTCRGPKVAFCTEPSLDGSDTCTVCMAGYALHTKDGLCYFEYWITIISGVVLIVVVLVIGTVWFVDMCCRPSVNEETVSKCQAWRSRSKIIDRREGSSGVYNTFSTNLCNEDIAGPGMVLHFRFQRFFIIWPLCIAVVWTLLACFHNELFILGTRKFGTPRHNCILVFWGYETQQRLMWTKVLFLAIVYLGSFVSFLVFSVSQLRAYQRMDATEKTMKDFALELKGLPAIKGEHKDAEQAVQKAIEVCTGMGEGAIVGVSMCWNYQEKQDEIFDASNNNLVRREMEYNLEQKNKRKPSKAEVDRALEEEEAKSLGSEADKPRWMPLSFWSKERKIICPEVCEKKTEEEEAKEVKKLLEELVSSDTAFVVFDTSEYRDMALKHMKDGGKLEIDATKFSFGKESLTLTEVTNEPMNVNFHNFGKNDFVLGFLKGFFKVYVPSLLIWFFCFYVPYAWSLYNFNYDNGAELPGYFSFVFTIIVCGGNATMYVVCDLCCDIIGFRLKDTKQVTYMLMYLAACMVNVFLDMVVTYFVAFKVMVGLDFRTYDGTRLAHIDVFTEQFETYAMQRSLGANTFAYCWPSTFFLCFVIEPFVTIMIPYQIGKIIIRTHREVRGPCAEAYLAAFEFDLGRYSDILLNVFLGIIIFFFPGGYIWGLFYAMAFSHTFIYCFDHWKVINVIPKLKIVSTEVDWWAQLMMCVCCGIILSCLVFKANCESYAGYCLEGTTLIGVTTLAGTLHTIIHALLLIFLVPKLGLDLEDENEGMKFSAVAAKEPRTWFSVNPVHCLRSAHIHEHKVQCRLATWGKEHLLEVNTETGCYYEGVIAQAEEFDIRKSFNSLKKSFDERAGEQKSN